jgi:hypothetical protein
MSSSDAPSGITAAKALSRSAAGISPTRTAVTGSATMPAAVKRSPGTEFHVTMAPCSASVDLRPSEPLSPSAVTQLRHSHSTGRAFYDRKLVEGHTPKEAIRALKRRLSNVVYRHQIADTARRR